MKAFLSLIGAGKRKQHLSPETVNLRLETALVFMLHPFQGFAEQVPCFVGSLRLVMRLGDHEQRARQPILISAKAVGPQALTQQRKTLLHMPSLDLYQPIIEAPRYCVISEPCSRASGISASADFRSA